MNKIPKKGTLSSIFIDLKSVFDTIDHEILFKKMHKMNIDNNLINKIEYIYE